MTNRNNSIKISVIIFAFLSMIGLYFYYKPILDWPSGPLINDPNPNFENIFSWNQNEITSWDISNLETEYEKFLEIKEIGTTINILNSPITSHFDPNNPVWNDEKVKEIYKTRSRIIPLSWKINTWYLYVRATVNWGKLWPKDSIYLYLYNKWWHLLKAESLMPTAENETILLYNLNNIKFAKLPTSWYSDLKKMESYSNNRQEILNDNSKRNYFFWFVSTSRNWRLEEVMIVYK